MEEGRRLLDANYDGSGLQQFFSKHAAAVYSALLMALIAVERFTFKLMVDRMAPFRFVLAQAVAVCYAIAVSFVVLRRSRAPADRGVVPDGYGGANSAAREVNTAGGMEGFPLWRLAMMALLDMLHLVPMIVAAADVAPTLTVLLLQCSAPFCLAVAAIFCRRRYPDRSVSGALVIFVGAGIAMFLPISRWVEADERMQERQEGAGSDMGAQDETYSGRLRGGTGEYAIVEGFNTVLYMLACIPAAISTVYKQYALELHGRAVDAHQLSLGVTAFEVFFIALAAPFAYTLQGIGRQEEGTDDVLHALQNGWRCLVFMEDVEDRDGYPVDAQCWGGLPLVFLYVISTLIVNTLVQKVVDSAESPAAYHRAMSLSVPAAFCVLCLYNQEVWLRDSLNLFTVIGLAVIMLGLRLYHSMGPTEEARDNFDPASSPAYG